MIPTIPYIEQKFEEFNKLMFEGKLPKIPIALSNAKTFMGKCEYKKRRTKSGEIEYYDFKIRINTRVDLPEQDVEDTIIHEMIHYYIRLNRIEDESSHGPVFQKIMNDINERFNRHIKDSFEMTLEQKEQFAVKRKSYHVVALVRFYNGNVGIKVLPRVGSSILKFHNIVLSSREVDSVELYLSNNIYFNRFPNSTALLVFPVDEAKLKETLEDATYLPCDGHNVYEPLTSGPPRIR